MTAVNWMIDALLKRHSGSLGKEYVKIFEQAREMEKQQMQDFGARCCLLTKQKNEWTLEELYKDLYGNKGSDDASSQTEISDEEINEKAEEFEFTNGIYGFKQGVKWTIEQLKKKQ